MIEVWSHAAFIIIRTSTISTNVCGGRKSYYSLSSAHVYISPWWLCLLLSCKGFIELQANLLLYGKQCFHTFCRTFGLPQVCNHHDETIVKGRRLWDYSAVKLFHNNFARKYFTKVPSCSWRLSPLNQIWEKTVIQAYKQKSEFISDLEWSLCCDWFVLFYVFCAYFTPKAMKKKNHR